MFQWTGCVANALDYFEDQAKTLGDLDHHRRDINRARQLLQDPNATADDLLDAANRVQKLLSARHDLYSGWLKHQFKSLYKYMDKPAILDSLKQLHQKGAMLMTTNYDDMLEKHLDIPPIDRSDPHALVSYQRGSLNAVFHPHGHWRNADGVVLSAEDYYGVKGHKDVQEVLKHILATKTVLFVGCGGGLSDPNFGKLMEWIGEKHKTRGATHYLLLSKSQENPVTELALNHVQCESFDDIGRWLGDLLDMNERREGISKSLLYDS